MTIERVDEIKQELEESKEERTRAKVKIEGIEKQWKDDHDVDDLDGAEEHLSTVEKQIKKLEEKESKLDEEIEGLLDDMEGEE